MIYPFSKFRISWDLFVCVLIVYNVFMIPFRLGFLDALGGRLQFRLLPQSVLIRLCLGF